ncbi:PepSY-associated TM helix domain-containing protein [Micromonospora sp. NPDC050200]|uniref:PepSY-associated TM helix domain-containing protein n=1 Tax=Micromonospora sp. NPDC050200 TaxID=3155664 RepID=UPI00340DF639
MDSDTTIDQISDKPVRPARRGMWSLLRPLVLRLHFYAGVLIAPFLLVAAVSGGLYALSPQVERVVYADLLEASSASSSARVPLTEQVAAATKVSTVPGLVAVRPAPEGGTTRVLFDDGTMAESYRHAVFVDPATGKVLGQEKVYGTSGALPVRSWIDELHRSLHLGEVGRLYSELAASWLWVVALGGLVLWVARVRARRSARALLLPESGAQGRARTRSWHGALGVWLVLGLLALSATGLTWSRLAGDNVTELRARVGWSTPTLVTTTASAAAGNSPSGHGDHRAAAGGTGAVNVDEIDQVLAAARAADITSDQVEIGLPAEPGATWTVTEVHRAFPTAVDAAAVDPATLAVTDTVRFAEYPFMAKLARWGVDIHMGVLFGLPNQIALAGLAIGLVVMVVLGYRMWWQRRPTTAAPWRPGPAVRAGGLWALPWPGLVAVAAVAAVFGIFLPLLGITLLAFLCVDLVLAAYRRRTSRAE